MGEKFTTYESFVKAIFRATQEIHMFGSDYPGQTHLDYFSLGYTDPPGDHVPCAELEIMGILSHQTTVLPMLQTNALTGLVVALTFCIILMIYLRGMASREIDLATTYYRKESLEKLFWDEAEIMQCRGGIKTIDLTVRRPGFKYDTPMDANIPEFMADEEIRTKILAEHGRAPVPNLVLIKRSAFIMNWVAFYLLTLLGLAIVWSQFNVKRDAYTTFTWMCETSVLMGHHLNYREQQAWTVTGFETADMCLLDMSNDLPYALRNLSALVFDRVHHNLQRLYIHETTPSISYVTPYLAVIIGGLLILHELFSFTQTIPFTFKKVNEKGKCVVTAQTHYQVTMKIVILVFIINTVVLLGGVMRDHIHDYSIEQCYAEQKKLDAGTAALPEAYSFLLNDTNGNPWDPNYESLLYKFSPHTRSRLKKKGETVNPNKNYFVPNNLFERHSKESPMKLPPDVLQENGETEKLL